MNRYHYASVFATTDALRWFADTAQRAIAAMFVSAGIVFGVLAALSVMFPRRPAVAQDYARSHMESLAAAKASTNEAR